MDRSFRAVVAALLVTLAVTSVLSVGAVLGIAVASFGVAGFVSCGLLAACAVVIMVAEGVRADG
jgi:hypothetical protein